MSSPSIEMRRHDLAMPEARAREVLERGFSGRLGTSDPDGWPYVVPLLYVCEGNSVHIHTARAEGHLVSDLRHDPRVCFLVDEAGAVYGYGRYECDSSVSYTSVMVFGKATPVTAEEDKSLFCTRLMEKYGAEVPGRPKNVFPRLEAICVYTIHIERITGKEIALPADEARWPKLDRTRSPGAAPAG